MATHSSILAWRIPRTKEPGGLQWKKFEKELEATEPLTTQQQQLQSFSLLWLFLFDTTPKLDRCHFLNVSDSVESETVSVNRLYSIKIHWSVLLLNGSFIHACFWNSYPGHSENSGSLSQLSDLPNVDTSHMDNNHQPTNQQNKNPNKQKACTFINVITNLIKLGMLSNSWQQMEVFQTLIFT